MQACFIGHRTICKDEQLISSLKQTILEQRSNLSKLYDIEAMPSVVILKNNETKKIQGADKEFIMHELKERLGEND